MKKKTTKVKPCPFCGEKARISPSLADYPDERQLWFVACDWTYSHEVTVYGRTRAAAIAAWNGEKK